MKLMYKDKERESTAFLDIAGVKDKSKVVLVEDSTAQAKRLLEMRKTDKMEKAAKAISAISLEVDRLASKVIILPPTIVYPSLSSNLHRIVIVRTIDRLGVGVGWDREQGREGGGDGQRRSDQSLASSANCLLNSVAWRLIPCLEQIRRVQKSVETLDAIKIKNWKPRGNGAPGKEQPQWPQPMQQRRDSQPYLQQQKMHLQQSQNQYPHQNRHQPPQSHSQQQQQQLNKPPQQAVVLSSMNWETFDSLFTTSTSTPTAAATSTPHARLDWELF
ncbi:hypothetical protein BHM03_00050129 [Ensete ventricosum]|nr:hypothetical protein BHM03_00050129 [Ensete ventricosum]